MNQSFQYRITTSRKPKEVFDYLMDPRNWWVGLFNETIQGRSESINDEFSFKAGDGLHYSNQKLVELIVGKKIVWLVVESNLSFLQNTNEWVGTKIGFDLEQENEQTNVIFTHLGLIPQIECFDGCSSAWTQYLQNLKIKLQ